ncbi:hypothetical protein [Marinigracilibium pacificum]|uniref:Uncharacterized protein n=1 Tax=Marinigracilibium pacificum TaxID=2729599 RepID=A0A848J4Y2_9BACT|nr:hypothetical protein [Marinigracilibium pacificum]NMM50776.1 hypothetical protein [Marinigracilibium pacificum]
MISEEQNIALIEVAKGASDNPAWKDYADYCLLKEKGLRKPALSKLNEFLNSTQGWSAEQRIEFVNFLFPLIETIPGADQGPFPHPLSIRLTKPTLEEWCAYEKSDSKPFRWFGKYYRSEEHLHKALEVNPEDDLARETILNWWTNILYFSIHHLPEGYIGDPVEDLEFAEKIKVQISRLVDPERRDYWTKQLGIDLEIIENYLEWKKSGHPDLASWGKENNKTVGYHLTRAYYFEK